MTTKAQAKDFSQSAEKLTNPEEVKVLLDGLHFAQFELDELQKQLREQSTELVEAIDRKQLEIAAIERDLKGDSKQGIVGAIEQYGSYQDTENEHYAVRYRRMIKDYHVPPFLKWWPQHAEAAIKQTINVQVLEGLVKGGLIQEEELKHKKVITVEAQYAYYIR